MCSKILSYQKIYMICYETKGYFKNIWKFISYSYRNVSGDKYRRERMILCIIIIFGVEICCKLQIQKVVIF